MYDKKFNGVMQVHIAATMLAVFSVAAIAQAQAEPWPWPDEDDVRVVINPQPRAELSRQTLHTWDLTDTDVAAAWEPVNDIASAEPRQVGLAIASTGPDPYLFGPEMQFEAVEGLVIRVAIRSEAGGQGQVFWATEDQPNFTEENSRRFDMVHDGEWHEYDVPVAADSDLTRLRLDPAEARGTVEVAHVAIDRVELHPFEIERVATNGEHLHAWVHYHGQTGQEDLDAVDLSVHYKAGPTERQLTQTVELDGRGRHHAVFELPDRDAPVARVDVAAEGGDVEPVSRRIRLHRPHVGTPESWPTLGDDDLVVRLHPSGLFARLYHDGERVGLIGPLVTLADGGSLHGDVRIEGERATIEGDEARVELRIEDGLLHAGIDLAADAQPQEVLTTRLLGSLEQGLLPGVEYLGKGEWSSSRADIETDEHVRFAPPRLHVTMPLLAFVTDRASLGMVYDDPQTTGPVFATPNFFDGHDDHRMAIRPGGDRIEAVYRVGPGWEDDRLEDVIEWAVRHRGVPEVAERPRSTQEQWDLSLQALHGVLRDENGWGHAAEERWARRFYSDIASTIWQLTGDMPDVPELVRGGAHLPNDAGYFVSGRAQQWLNQVNGQAAAVRNQQQPDGSFRYDGEYARTHFEDTASGHNGRLAETLLRHASYTGNAESLEAGLATLDYIERFRTPRGAQVWEMPLHTPDILGSGHVVRAYVLGYRLTGDSRHLEQARRWAITGLPFLYQWRWQDQQAMPYTVIAVKGATHWRSPNWIGLPVQWCGLRYADGLLMLAEHDDSFDWRQVAEGVLVSAEHQMYPDGELAGTLPDWFVLEAGERGGPSINPAAMVSLRLRLEGEVPNLAVAHEGGRRIVSPYPVTIDGNVAHVEAEAGASYEVVIDGQRIVSIEESAGTDRIPLD